MQRKVGNDIQYHSSLKELHSHYIKMFDYSKGIKVAQLLQQLQKRDAHTLLEVDTLIFKGETKLSREKIKKITNISENARTSRVAASYYQDFECDKAMKLCNNLEETSPSFPMKIFIDLRMDKPKETLDDLNKLPKDVQKKFLFSKAVAYFMLNNKEKSKKYLKNCLAFINDSNFTFFVRLFAMCQFQDIKLPDNFYRHEMVFFQDALHAFFQNAQMDFRSAYLKFDRCVEEIFREMIVDRNYLKGEQASYNTIDPTGSQQRPPTSSSNIRQRAIIHFTIDPKYLGFDRKLIDPQITVGKTGKNEWLDNPALNLKVLDEIKTLNYARFQKPIETPFFSGTYFTLDPNATAFDPSQRRTFVLAGRKAQAKIPQEEEGGNVILVIPKEDKEEAKKFWLAKNRDLLCIESIKEDGNDDKYLRLVNTRRRAVFSFAKEKNLKHFVIIDDNIDNFYLGKSKFTWKELYQLLQTTTSENNLTSLSAKTYKPELDKEPPKNETLSIEKTLGYKIFFIDAKKINESFERPDKELFPPSLDLWGEDIFCQLALDFAKMGVGSINRQGLIFTRSKKQRNLCKKSIKSARAWLEISETFTSELYSNVIKFIKDKVITEISRYEKNIKKLNHSNLADFYERQNRKRKSDNFTPPIGEKKIFHKKNPNKRQKIGVEVKQDLPLAKSEAADKIANILSTLQVNENCNTNTFNISYGQLIIEQIYRKCQEKALNSLSASLKNGERLGYIKMPTGTGKTKLINTLAYLFLISQNKNVLILSPTIGLVDQTYHNTMKFRERVTMKLGIYVMRPSYPRGIIPISHGHIHQQIAKNNKQLKQGGFITIVCDKSFTNFLKENPEGLHLFSAVLIDEMHTMPRELLKRIKNCVQNTDMIAIGFSATPSKNKALLGNKIYKYPINRAIEENILCPAKFDTHLSSESELWPSLTEKLMQDHPHGGKLIENKGIIYVSSISQAVDLEKVLNFKLSRGPISKAVTSAHGPLHTQNAINEFKTSKTMNILIAVGKLIVGFDAPVDYIIAAKKISNKTAWKQMIGRALRNNTPGYLRHQKGSNLRKKKIAYIITRNDSRPPEKYVKSIEAKDSASSNNERQVWFPGCGWSK